MRIIKKKMNRFFLENKGNMKKTMINEIFETVTKGKENAYAKLEPPGKTRKGSQGNKRTPPSTGFSESRSTGN